MAKSKQFISSKIMKPLVVILMGAHADLPYAQIIVDLLNELGIQTELRIGSPYKTPSHLLKIINKFEADKRPKVYITIAGLTNALSGFVDAQVQSPVIACPPMRDIYSRDDIFSSLRHPSGVAPATVLDPEGAAILAAKMLSLFDTKIRQHVAKLQKQYIDRLITDNAKVANPR